MRLATFKTAQGASYGIVTSKGIVDLKRYIGNQYPDLLSLIAGNGFADAAKHANETPDYQSSDVIWLPVIPNPGKILCVGLNYQDHVVLVVEADAENLAGVRNDRQPDDVGGLVVRRLIGMLRRVGEAVARNER